VIAKRMQASKANKVMASIMPEFANFQVKARHSMLRSAVALTRAFLVIRRRALGCSKENDVSAGRQLEPLCL
jgi:hypothetical protein